MSPLHWLKPISRSRPLYVHSSCVSHLAHTHQTLMSTHHTCRIWLMLISRSRPPIMHVAFSACPSYAHVHPSCMLHLAHAHLALTSTHLACRIWLMPTSRSRPPSHQACRIWRMPISRSSSPMMHVAFSSYPSHGHVHPSCMSHLAHRLTLKYIYRACRI